MKQKRKNEVKKLRCSCFLEGKQNLCLGYGEGLMQSLPAGRQGQDPLEVLAVDHPLMIILDILF